MPDILTAEEVAELLRLNIRTVTKLANQGKLPYFKIANQYRFSKEKLKLWLDQSINQLSDNILREIDLGRENTSLSLESITSPAHILHDMQTTDRNQTIRKLVATAVNLNLVKDQELFYKKIIEREEQLSTCLGNGLALPHPRSIDSSVISGVIAVIGVHKSGVEFSTQSTEKSHIIILLAAPELSVHLKLISHITRLFKSASVRNSIIESNSAEHVYHIIKNQEREII